METGRKPVIQVRNLHKVAAYGRALLECFRRCREELSSSYALFHLDWVLEWYEANRQYKQAVQLMREFS